ncbi:hypothetical protein C7974DRAFT_397247 [Boeremia exigua]|uniref:uncharacterized protein n=1 Tax=Boeremia exigua TaxID=749465 RepID=UPI001E8D6BF0|nr:uncharacterized protein C7974DRAFT_397247 [Boeremia exigua]KAH6621850.1 hypothetical protein C7974DRAFT_397247 [Boeremia exigua]
MRTLLQPLQQHNIVSALILQSSLAMPFCDREWEDFQRDCDFFPAYTDYIFGVDTRPEVAEQPGLHPQLHQPPLPRQRLCGLPSPKQQSIVYDPVRDETRARPFSTPKPRPAALTTQESSMESMLRTPCPAPRALPATSPPMPLLRSNELTTDPQYSSVPIKQRAATNMLINQAWRIMNSDADPAQKAKAMGYINEMSRVAAIERHEYQTRMAAKLEAERRVEREWQLYDKAVQAEAEKELQAMKQEQQTMKQEQQAMKQEQHISPPYNHPAAPESQHAEMGHAAERAPTRNGNFVCNMFQLSAYVHQNLPQLWSCTEIIALQAPPADPGQLHAHRQAQESLMGFMQTVPPNGRPWLNIVMDGMIKLRRHGGDPMAVLQFVPGLEEVCGMGQGLQSGQASSFTQTQ